MSTFFFSLLFLFLLKETEVNDSIKGYGGGKADDNDEVKKMSDKKKKKQEEKTKMRSVKKNKTRHIERFLN